MIELLKLCGFEGQEIESELPRIEKVFDRLGITAADIERGKQRLNKYYDIDLRSVRKALRLCLRELVNTVLAREERKKVIYGFMSGDLDTIGAALMSKSKEIYSARIEFIFLLVLGGIFDKLTPVLEAAEKKWLKAGVVAHCGNTKTITGLLALDLIPRPDLLGTTGFLCETAPKTLYLLHDLYDIPVGYFDTCQDIKFGEDAEATKRTVDFAEKSLRKLVEKVQELVGFEVTDAMLLEVLDARKRFGDASRKMGKLIESSDPLPVRPATANIWACMGALPLNRDRLPEAIETINTAYEELQERVNQGIGVVEKGAPRIIAPLPMHHADPRMEHLITEMGIALVPSGISGPPAGPTTEGEMSPYLEMSKGVGGSMGAGLVGRIHMIIEECKRMKVDGLLDRFHAGCRTMVGDAIIMKEAVEKEVGIPVFLLEWENFDPRVYQHEEYKRRLAVFKTMLAKRSA
jgi:benzoyl-CoA reductase/2-hydroxyglutaryl-CoA dehydratase subunit BcrC/BadD/HgdB